MTSSPGGTRFNQLLKGLTAGKARSRFGALEVLPMRALELTGNCPPQDHNYLTALTPASRKERNPKVLNPPPPAAAS